MKIFNLLIILLIFTNQSLGQSLKGIVNDKDEYTNLRTGKGIKFSVIRKVLKGEIFYYTPHENDDWWFIETQNGSKGYIHKSRIAELKELEYKNCIYKAPDLPRKNPNFIFKFNNSIVSICGEVDEDYQNKDEIKLYGVDIYDCTNKKHLSYLGDF